MRNEERMDRIFGKGWQRTEMPTGKIHATDLNVPALNIAKYDSLDLKANPPITVLGKYKAIMTARAIQNRNLTPKIIISSPALRSVETASAIAGYLKIPFAIEPGLSDHPIGTVDYGREELLKIFKIDTEYQPVMPWSDFPTEKFEDVGNRVEEVLRALVEKEHSHPLFIVAHSLVQLALCHLANGEPLIKCPLKTKPLDPVELGLRFPPGSILTAARLTEMSPHAYSIVKDMVPSVSCGDCFSSFPIPL